MNALPFVAEFMLTGGYSALSNATSKAVTSAFGKYASKKFVKNLGVFAGDLASSYAMANTTGAARTYADIMGREMGDLTRDENGNYKFENGESMNEAYIHGMVANTLEYYTEKLGEHLKLGKGLSDVANNFGLKKLSKAINYVSNNKWLERGGIQDYPSEVIEEEANMVLNAALVGDNNFVTDPNDPRYAESVLNLKNHLEIAGGMFFSIGLMSVMVVMKNRMSGYSV